MVAFTVPLSTALSGCFFVFIALVSVGVATAVFSFIRENALLILGAPVALLIAWKFWKHMPSSTTRESKNKRILLAVYLSGSFLAFGGALYDFFNPYMGPFIIGPYTIVSGSWFRSIIYPSGVLADAYVALAIQSCGAFLLLNGFFRMIKIVSSSKAKEIETSISSCDQ